MNNPAATNPTALEPVNFDPNKAEVVNPRGIETVYANNAAVMAMQHDFRMVFSEIVVEGPTNSPRLELRANVALSPTMLKAIYEAIGKTIEMYEDNISEITWPPKPRKIK
jgi:hypothetical protein